MDRKDLTLSYHEDWFTEGLDTADLKDARALLDELCARSRTDGRATLT